MATLTKDQIQRLMDSGMSVYDIRAAAERNGDTMPGPTLFGAAANPFFKGAARFGQAIGSLALSAFGVEPVVKNAVFRAPGVGTLPIEEQKPLSTQQGQRQILGLGAELGANFVPIGRVGKALSPYVGKTLGYATGLGASGYGFETGTKLQEGAPDAYTPGLGTAIPAAIPIVGKVIGATAPALRFGLAKASGLTPDEITTIITRPSEFQAARAENLNRISLGNLINERFKALKSEVSDLGKSYQPIRESGQVVKVTESPFQKVLSRLKIGFENGKVRLTSESPALSSSDVSSIERLYNQFGQTDTLSSNAYLNLRNAADELANWRTDPSRTSFSERIFRELRREYDDVAKTQITGLKELDNQYAPVKKELTELTKEYLQFRDGQWGLKDAAVSKITNATNKGREQVLSRLEKYVPGITQQIQLVRALEGVQAASGIRVGTYGQSASLLLGGGLFAAGANPAFALLALAVSMPEVVVPILIAFGKARGVAEGAMRAFIGKLVAGKTLTEQELKLFKDALLEHLNKVSPGDQFFDSPLGQRSFGLTKDLKLGLVIDDVSGIPKELAPLAQEAKKYKSAEEFVNSIKPASETLNKLESQTANTPVNQENVSSFIKVYHGTTNEAAKSIENSGFKIMPTQRFGRYSGDGIYFSPEKFGKWGSDVGGKELDAYVDIRNYKNVYLPEGNIDWQPGSDLVNEWKKKYDGIILRIKDTNTATGNVEADFVNEIVAFNPDTVKTKSQLTDLWNKVNGGTVKTNALPGKVGVGTVAGLGAAATGIGAALTATNNMEIPAPEEPQNNQTQNPIDVRGVAVQPSDIDLIKRILFSEVSNRSRDKKELEARVILNTVINRVLERKSVMGIDSSIQQELTNGEYQGYESDLYKQYDNPPDEPSRKRKEEVNAVVEKLLEELRDGTFSDNTEGSSFYQHDGDKIYYEKNKRLYK